jgi:hypothetical protein
VQIPALRDVAVSIGARFPPIRSAWAMSETRPVLPADQGRLFFDEVRALDEDASKTAGKESSVPTLLVIATMGALFVGHVGLLTTVLLSQISCLRASSASSYPVSKDAGRQYRGSWSMFVHQEMARWGSLLIAAAVAVEMPVGMFFFDACDHPRSATAGFSAVYKESGDRCVKRVERWLSLVGRTGGCLAVASVGVWSLVAQRVAKVDVDASFEAATPKVGCCHVTLRGAGGGRITVVHSQHPTAQGRSIPERAAERAGIGFLLGATPTAATMEHDPRVAALLREFKDTLHSQPALMSAAAEDPASTLRIIRSHFGPLADLAMPFLVQLFHTTRRRTMEAAAVLTQSAMTACMLGQDKSLEWKDGSVVVRFDRFLAAHATDAAVAGVVANIRSLASPPPSEQQWQGLLTCFVRWSSRQRQGSHLRDLYRTHTGTSQFVTPERTSPVSPAHAANMDAHRRRGEDVRETWARHRSGAALDGLPSSALLLVSRAQETNGSCAVRWLAGWSGCSDAPPRRCVGCCHARSDSGCYGQLRHLVVGLVATMGDTHQVLLAVDRRRPRPQGVRCWSRPPLHHVWSADERGGRHCHMANSEAAHHRSIYFPLFL